LQGVGGRAPRRPRGAKLAVHRGDQGRPSAEGRCASSSWRADGGVRPRGRVDAPYLSRIGRRRTSPPPKGGQARCCHIGGGEGRGQDSGPLVLRDRTIDGVGKPLLRVAIRFGIAERARLPETAVACLPILRLRQTLGERCSSPITMRSDHRPRLGGFQSLGYLVVIDRVSAPQEKAGGEVRYTQGACRDRGYPITRIRSCRQLRE